MDSNYSNKILDIKGCIEIQSSLSIIELGNIISESIFGGIPFEGLETNVYNEVPAIFFRKNLLDLEVTLFGFPTGVENGSYHLQLIPNHNLINEVSVDIDISYFLYKLIQQKIGKIIEKIVVFDHSEY